MYRKRGRGRRPDSVLPFFLGRRGVLPRLALHLDVLLGQLHLAPRLRHVRRQHLGPLLLAQDLLEPLALQLALGEVRAPGSLEPQESVVFGARVVEAGGELIRGNEMLDIGPCGGDTLVGWEGKVDDQGERQGSVNFGEGLDGEALVSGVYLEYKTGIAILSKTVRMVHKNLVNRSRKEMTAPCSRISLLALRIK